MLASISPKKTTASATPHRTSVPPSTPLRRTPATFRAFLCARGDRAQAGYVEAVPERQHGAANHHAGGNAATRAIERDVIRSPLSTKLQKESPSSLIETEGKLMIHIRQLGAAVVETNDDFMFHLFEQDKALSAKPHAYSRGSWEKIAFAMQTSYATWREIEGVLGLLSDARACVRSARLGG
ncbi:hypothetical protein E0Z10_g3889 [Xylaria hypoxylon]|uniref:Uncharacterized protein n=1 Tax=Xylaria hypoxylon TaxID=37992 RepID=A0A4Z0YZG8_9PEZI|nr:hypothetical protein E0Z10_g3889 [Xylaria hypoxylon]